MNAIISYFTMYLENAPYSKHSYYVNAIGPLHPFCPKNYNIMSG